MVYMPNQISPSKTGSQAWFRELTIGPDGFSATVEFINGYRSTQTLSGESLLSVGDQQLVGVWSVQEIEPGDQQTIVVTFPPLDSSGGGAVVVEDATVVLALNVDENGQPNSSLLRPSFSFDPLVLSEATSPTELPEAFPVTMSASSLSGTAVEITGLSFDDVRIGVGIVAVNVRGTSRNLGGTSDETFLIDDLGNRYGLVAQSTNARLAMERFEKLEGQLVFAGHLHPDATSLTLIINAESDPTDKFTPRPFFSFGPIALDGSAPLTGTPDGLSPGEIQQHANTVEATLASIEFENDRTIATLLVNNPRSGKVTLNAVSSTALVDNTGNRYSLVEPPENESIEVQGGASATVSLVFAGVIDPLATSLELLVNDRGEQYRFDDSTISPGFLFGPYDVSDRQVAGTRLPASRPDETSVVVALAFEGRTVITR